MFYCDNDGRLASVRILGFTFQVPSNNFLDDKLVDKGGTTSNKSPCAILDNNRLQNSVGSLTCLGEPLSDHTKVILESQRTVNQEALVLLAKLDILEAT